MAYKLKTFSSAILSQNESAPQKQTVYSVIMALPTANWDSLGQQVFKKQEFCQLQWGAKISLDEYDIFAASYGGPIGE